MANAGNNDKCNPAEYVFGIGDAKVQNNKMSKEENINQMIGKKYCFCRITG